MIRLPSPSSAVQLSLPDECADSFAISYSGAHAIDITITGVYAVEYELTIRAAVSLRRLRLLLCRNDQPSPGAFIERQVSHKGRDDAAEITLRGKTIIWLSGGDTLSLAVSSPDSATSGGSSIETCDGPNALLFVHLLRASSLSPSIS